MYIPFNVRWCYTFQIAVGGGEYSGSTSHSYTLRPGHPSSKCVQHHKESNINFVVLVTTYFLLEVGNGTENILSKLFFQLSLLLSNMEAVSSHKWQSLNTTWLPLLDHEAQLVFNDLWNGNTAMLHYTLTKDLLYSKVYLVSVSISKSKICIEKQSIFPNKKFIRS